MKKNNNVGTKLSSPVRQGTPQTLTLRSRKHQNHLRRKALITRRRKHQKHPKENNPGPKTQKLPETIQGEKPRKPENCRARRRRESQLTTAAPLESSALSWIPRGNALASWTCRHQEPRTAPVEVVQHAGGRGSLIGPGSSKNRTRYIPSSFVLALIFPSHHNPSSPLYQKWAPLGSTVSW